MLQKHREQLHAAIHNGDLEKVSTLLDNPSATVNQNLVISKNCQGRTSAHIAILCDKPKILQLLLNTVPQLITATDNVSNEPLHPSVICKNSIVIIIDIG